MLSILPLGRLLALLPSVDAILLLQVHRLLAGLLAVLVQKILNGHKALRSQKEYDFTESSNGFLELEIYVASYLISFPDEWMEASERS